ncbi:MAG: hypothetical protein WC974_02880 [Thermoplasmata archaeon]
MVLPTKVKEILIEQNVETLKELDEFVRHLISTRSPEAPKRKAIHYSYIKKYVRCGKERCRKCRSGRGHGPYLYAEWREGGKVKTKYIGKKAPASSHIH